MVVTTTENIRGMKITHYLGLVTGEAVKGLIFYKDFFATLRDAWGGRVRSYEKEILEGVREATTMMVRRCEKLGGNAILGVNYDIEVLSPRGKGTMILLLVSGTAVEVHPEIAQE